MRAKKPLTPIQVRKLMLNPCKRDDVKLAKRIAGLRIKHAERLSDHGMRLLTHCIQSLMGVRR